LGRDLSNLTRYCVGKEKEGTFKRKMILGGKDHEIEGTIRHQYHRLDETRKIGTFVQMTKIDERAIWRYIHGGLNLFKGKEEKKGLVLDAAFPKSSVE